MKLLGGKYPFLLVFMTILFGLSFIATKNALEGLGIFQVVFGRYLFALVVLTFILGGDRKKFYIARKDWKDFLLLTLVEPVGYFIFETLGVRFTTPSSVSLIIATIPAFSIVFAFWLLKEKSGKWAFLGIVLSLIGVYFIVSTQSSSRLAPNPILGNLFTLGAATAAGLYNVLCRRLSRTYSPLTITYYQSIVATAVFLPLAAIQSILRPDFHINWFIILNILYLGIGSSVVAYLILNYTLKHLLASQVAIFANLIPVVTILGSWFVYGELLKPMQFLGAGFIILGIYFTYARPLKIQPSAPPG
ncbi:MAG: DMT family transporter [Calditrichia bacterium]